MKEVYLLTSGDGEDGNEWRVLGIFSSQELAEKAKSENKNKDDITIETWTLDERPYGEGWNQ